MRVIPMQGRSFGPRVPLSTTARDDRLLADRLRFALRYARQGTVKLGVELLNADRPEQLTEFDP